MLEMCYKIIIIIITVIRSYEIGVVDNENEHMYT